MKLPTIKDIALEAGVNKCVVSHVMHNDAYAAKMRPETRQRILDIAAKLHYIPNQLACATSTGKVNTIAVILDFNVMQNQFTANQIMTGIVMETARRGLSVKVFSEDDLENAFRVILGDRIGKVISASVEAAVRERTAELAEKYSLDLVFCYEHGHGKFPAVNADNVEMTSKMVRYLADRGHTRIGLLCVPHRYHYQEDRHQGYLSGMAQCGLSVDPRWISCSDDIERSVEKMLALPKKQRPTACVALADPVAAAAQRYAIKRGLRVPEDFSVIGIGNTECSQFAVFPLTTLEETFPETGKMLVRLLMKDPIEVQPDEFNVYRTHAELIERDSVYDIKQTKKMEV